MEEAFNIDVTVINKFAFLKANPPIGAVDLEEKIKELKEKKDKYQGEGDLKLKEDEERLGDLDDYVDNRDKQRGDDDYHHHDRGQKGGRGKDRGGRVAVGGYGNQDSGNDRRGGYGNRRDGEGTRETEDRRGKKEKLEFEGDDDEEEYYEQQ